MSLKEKLIEKMAVWYELRYPDYEIRKLMYFSSQDKADINKVMFQDNPYINSLGSEIDKTKKLKWSEFYNACVFERALPIEERVLISMPKYPEIVYLSIKPTLALIQLTREGFIKNSKGVGEYTFYSIKDENIKGLHIKDVINLFNEKKIKLPENCDIPKIIEVMDELYKERDELINQVIQKIIDRGDNEESFYRSALFAKEYGKSINGLKFYDEKFKIKN